MKKLFLLLALGLGAWQQLEFQLGPQEIPGLKAFILGARDKRIDEDAWKELVASQGPEALRLAQECLNPELVAATPSHEVRRQDNPGVRITHEGGVEYCKKCGQLFEPLLLLEDDRLLKWARASPENRALVLRILALYQPERESFQGQKIHEAYLCVLIQLDPQAALPYLESCEHLLTLEQAQFLQSQPELLVQMRAKGGRLLAHSLSLPLILATDDRPAMAKALTALPADAFIHEDVLLEDVFLLLGANGLTKESLHLKAGDTKAGKWRQIAFDLLAGNITEIAVFQQACTDVDDMDNLTSIVLLGNGDPERRRLAEYLRFDGDDDAAVASMFKEEIGRSITTGDEENEERRNQKYLAHLNATPVGVIQEFHRYLFATLRGDKKAPDHLEAALKLAPQSLPLLLEKSLASTGVARQAALRSLFQALPADVDWANWLHGRLYATQVEPAGPEVAAWLQRLPTELIKDQAFPAIEMAEYCLGKADCSVLLPVVDISTKVLILLNQRQKDKAKALLNEMLRATGTSPRDNFERDWAQFVLHLLGGPKPEFAPGKNTAMMAVWAGMNGGAAPAKSGKAYEDSIDLLEWHLGKGFACLRKGDLVGARAAQAAGDKLIQEEGANSNLLHLFRVFMAAPELLAKPPAP